MTITTTQTPETATTHKTTTMISVTPKAQSVMRWLGWSFTVLLFLVLFTFIKLPQTRIKNLIHGSISTALAEKNITFTSGESRLSVGLGITYTMNDVTLNLPKPQPKVHIDRIEVSPVLLPMIMGKMGAKVRLYQGDASLKTSFSTSRGATDIGDEFSISFIVNDIDLGKTGVLQIASGLSGSATVNGEGSVSGNISNPSSLSGAVQLRLKKLSLDPQTIKSFSVPKLSISEANINLVIQEGKATLQALNLGKPESLDDIIATVSGDVQLAKQWDSSTINLKTRFSFSPDVQKAFVLLDALLAPGKQPDGTYAYNLSGSLYSPIPNPVNSP
jgi:type II secretion system protein N